MDCAVSSHAVGLQESAQAGQGAPATLRPIMTQGRMSESTFFILFGVTWVVTAAYVLSAWRLLVRVRKLKNAGKASDAPDPFAGPLEVFGYLGWLLSGRYAGLDDEVAARWAGVARMLFVVALPSILAIFAVALTQPGGWSQPT